MNYLTILKLIIQLLPITLEAVKAAEAAIPQSGAGAAKFLFVKELLTSTVDISTDIDKAAYASAIEKVITLAVALFNKTGVFSKAA